MTTTVAPNAATTPAARAYPVTGSRIDAALLILRIVVGLVFIMHGGQKFFVFGIGGATGAFSQMGIPLPHIAAPVVATVELLGGLALVFGIITRIAAALLAIDMLGAIAFVHLKGGFFLPSGFEFALALLGTALALALAGAGRFSVDGIITSRRR